MIFGGKARGSKKTKFVQVAKKDLGGHKYSTIRAAVSAAFQTVVQLLDEVCSGPG